MDCELRLPQCISSTTEYQPLSLPSMLSLSQSATGTSNTAINTTTSTTTLMICVPITTKKIKQRKELIIIRKHGFCRFGLYPELFGINLSSKSSVVKKQNGSKGKQPNEVKHKWPAIEIGITGKL